jgi:hypothetical protein
MIEDKKLNVDYLEEVTDQYGEQQEITIKIQTKNGVERVSLMVDKLFSPAKVELCVKELIQKLDYLRPYVNKKDDSESLLQCWFMLLLIKHFTSLDIPYDFKRQVAVLDKMIETNILFQIFSEFETTEIEKAMHELEVRTLEANKRIDELEDDFIKIEKNKIEHMKKIQEIMEKK